jgi:hypothetical protein
VADPNRHAVNLNLDNPTSEIHLVLPSAPPTTNRTLRGRRFHNRQNEPQRMPVIAGRRRLPRLSAPAKQLLRRQSMPPRHRADRLATRHTLGDNPSLVFRLQVRRRPEPVNTSIRRTGSVIALCSVSILSLTVKTQRRLTEQ